MYCIFNNVFRTDDKISQVIKAQVLMYYPKSESAELKMELIISDYERLQCRGHNPLYHTILNKLPYYKSPFQFLFKRNQFKPLKLFKNYYKEYIKLFKYNSKSKYSEEECILLLINILEKRHYQVLFLYL